MCLHILFKPCTYQFCLQWVWRDVWVVSLLQSPKKSVISRQRQMKQQNPTQFSLSVQINTAHRTTSLCHNQSQQPCTMRRRNILKFTCTDIFRNYCEHMCLTAPSDLLHLIWSTSHTLPTKTQTSADVTTAAAVIAAASVSFTVRFGHYAEQSLVRSRWPYVIILVILGEALVHEKEQILKLGRKLLLMILVHTSPWVWISSL